MGIRLTLRFLLQVDKLGAIVLRWRESLWIGIVRFELFGISTKRMIATKVIVITTLISLHEIGEASFLARWFRLLLWMLPLFEVEMNCGMLTSPEKDILRKFKSLLTC